MWCSWFVWWQVTGVNLLYHCQYLNSPSFAALTPGLNRGHTAEDYFHYWLTRCDYFFWMWETSIPVAQHSDRHLQLSGLVRTFSLCTAVNQWKSSTAALHLKTRGCLRVFWLIKWHQWVNSVVFVHTQSWQWHTQNKTVIVLDPSLFFNHIVLLYYDLKGLHSVSIR